MAEKGFPKECETMVTVAHSNEDRHRFVIKYYSSVSDEIRFGIENAAWMIAKDEKFNGVLELKEIFYDYVYSIVRKYYDYKCVRLNDTNFYCNNFHCNNFHYT